MTSTRPYSLAIDRLRAVGLRPTRQRMALMRQLFDAGDRHVSAEQLFAEVKGAGVSLATVYNTLHQLTSSGLLREVVVEPGRSYFDTNTSEHHHFYCEDSGELHDIPGDRVRVVDLPAAPPGATVRRVDVIIRISSSATPDERSA
jgi:Fur family transcriptional regulator, iron response regulator